MFSEKLQKKIQMSTKDNGYRANRGFLSDDHGENVVWAPLEKFGLHFDHYAED